MLSEKAAMIFILIITAFFITYFYRARDGIRTRDPRRGKAILHH